MKNKIKSFLCSSIGKKKIMGLSGLGLCGFVLSHMVGNLLIFKGAQAYNEYGHNMTHMPAFIIIESGLLGMIFIHFFMGISLAYQNKSARNTSYAMTPAGEKEASLTSRLMINTGSIVAIFIVLHLMNFRFGTVYEVTYNGVVMRDLHRLMVEHFTTPWWTGFYVVSVLLLMGHLMHGFWSSFQSLGLMTSKYSCAIKRLSWVYAAVVCLGFAAQPIYVYLMARN